MSGRTLSLSTKSAFGAAGSDARWPQKARCWDVFKQRLNDAHLRRLKYLDVSYRPLEGPNPAAQTIP